MIQRRVDDSVTFKRGWEVYVRGFGSQGHNYWAGLEVMHLMTLMTLCRSKEEESVMSKVEDTHKKLAKLPDNDSEKVTHFKRVEDANNCYKKIMQSASKPYVFNHAELTQIWQWFNDNKASIDAIIHDYPISEFPTSSVEDQRKCQIRCKILFSEFRSVFFKDFVIKKNFAEEKVFPVQTKDLKAAADLMLDMNKALSFEGVPQSKGGSTAEKRMLYELHQAVEEFAETCVWPDKIVSLRNRHNHFVVAIQLDNLPILQKLSSAIESQLAAFPDADYNNIIEELKYAEDMVKEQKAQFDQMKDSDKDSTTRFGGQDSNLDRAFQFIYKLVKSHPTVPSLKLWSQAMQVVKGVGSRMLKQDLVVKKLKKTGLPIFKNIELNLPGESARFSKFQHPLLISVKRWCNGAACFTGISSVGPLLNIMHDPDKAMTQLLLLDGHLQNEMVYFHRHAKFTKDKALVYKRSRISYWLFHQLIKGTTGCLTWAGETTGNSLAIKFVASE